TRWNGPPGRERNTTRRNVFEPRSTTARLRSSGPPRVDDTLTTMTPTPLRPPSLEEAGDALAPAAPLPLAWPTVFDTPSTVDRAWTDFVAGQGEAERL